MFWQVTVAMAAAVFVGKDMSLEEDQMAVTAAMVEVSSSPPKQVSTTCRRWHITNNGRRGEAAMVRVQTDEATLVEIW